MILSAQTGEHSHELEIIVGADKYRFHVCKSPLQ